MAKNRARRGLGSYIDQIPWLTGQESIESIRLRFSEQQCSGRTRRCGQDDMRARAVSGREVKGKKQKGCGVGCGCAGKEWAGLLAGLPARARKSSWAAAVLPDGTVHACAVSLFLNLCYRSNNIGKQI